MLPIALSIALLLLPHQDDPAPERGVRTITERATPGYTLFSPLASTTTYLVDLDGEVVHAWETEHNPSSMVYLRPNGNLVRCGHVASPRFSGGGMGGILQEFTWEGELVWEHRLADDGIHQHHDVELLPDGNLLVLAWEYVEREEAVARGRDPRAVGARGLWPDVVHELKPTPPTGAEVVWEWHAWDHLIQDFDEGAPDYGSIPDAPERIDVNADHRDRPAITAAERKRLREMEEQMRALGYAGDDEEDEPETPSEEDLRRLQSPDWLHTNAVAYLPEYDLIALSTPELCEVWVIDHSTTSAEAAGSTGGRYGKGGDLLWRWGNPRNYGRGKTADKRLFYQHDPTWLLGTDDALSLLVFNNGGGRPDGDWSSVIELALPFDPAEGFARATDAAFGPAEPAWSYVDREGFYASFISGAQRLPGGNTLVCAGPEGRLFEVTPAGEIVWDFLSPLGGDSQPGAGHPDVPANAIFRAHRYAPDHPALVGRL